MCQTSSLDFLSSQNFDFNKLFKEGVSYLKPTEEKKLRDSITEKQTSRKSNISTTPNRTPGGNGDIAVPSEQQTFIDSIVEKTELFVSSNAETFDLPKCNPFQRKLIYQTLRQKFKDVYLESVQLENRDRIIRLHKLNEEQQKKKADAKDKAEFDDLDKAIGFSRVIRKLSESGKLVVGHNMILDICHTLNQFVEPLPSDYPDFKRLCQATFPKILDTKLMASTYPFKDEISNSSLEELMNTVSQKPYEMPKIEPHMSDCGYNLTTEKYHEAGYDAFVTGLCFIAMSNRLGKLSQSNDVKHMQTGACRVLPNHVLISPFLNKMYLMRIADIPYMNLAGDDIEPNRDHVFHVTFPSDWKTFDLINLFSPFGPVYVSWLGDTTAFVSLNLKENSASVMKTLTNGTTYSVMPYKQFKAFEKVRGQTGITPMMENCPVGFTTPKRFFASNPPKLQHSTASSSGTNENSKKRSISPEIEKFKRTKSVNEDESPKGKTLVTSNPFEEPPWE